MEWARIVLEDFAIVLCDEVEEVKAFVDSDVAKVVVVHCVREDVVERVDFAIVYELDAAVVDE